MPVLCKSIHAILIIALPFLLRRASQYWPAPSWESGARSCLLGKLTAHDPLLSFGQYLWLLYIRYGASSVPSWFLSVDRATPACFNLESGSPYLFWCVSGFDSEVRYAGYSSSLIPLSKFQFPWIWLLQFLRSTCYHPELCVSLPRHKSACLLQRRKVTEQHPRALQ